MDRKRRVKQLDIDDLMDEGRRPRGGSYGFACPNCDQDSYRMDEGYCPLCGYIRPRTQNG